MDNVQIYTCFHFPLRDCINSNPYFRRGWVDRGRIGVASSDNFQIDDYEVWKSDFKPGPPTVRLSHGIDQQELVTTWWLHPSFAEVRVQNQVWRNSQFAKGEWSSDSYIGFQHYRRRLFFQVDSHIANDGVLQGTREFLRGSSIVYMDLPYREFKHLEAAQDNGDPTATRRMFQDLCERRGPQAEPTDVIVPRPWSWNVGQQFQQAHGAAYWSSLVGCLLPYREYLGVDPNAVDRFWPGNLFVMRWPVFCEYMEFQQKVMEHFCSVEQPPDDAYQRRLYGFICERLFSIWFFRRRDKLWHFTVPHLFCSNYPVS